MPKEILKVQSIISGARTMADKTIRLQADCQEMAPEDAATLMLLKDKIGWLFFAEQEIPKEEMINLPEFRVEKGQKTESQRLRGVLYLLWEKNKTTDTFDEYYKKRMNAEIEKLKTELDW